MEAQVLRRFCVPAKVMSHGTTIERQVSIFRAGNKVTCSINDKCVDRKVIYTLEDPDVKLFA